MSVPERFDVTGGRCQNVHVIGDGVVEKMMGQRRYRLGNSLDAKQDKCLFEMGVGGRGILPAYSNVLAPNVRSSMPTAGAYPF